MYGNRDKAQYDDSQTSHGLANANRGAIGQPTAQPQGLGRPSHVDAVVDRGDPVLKLLGRCCAGKQSGSHSVRSIKHQ